MFCSRSKTPSAISALSPILTISHLLSLNVLLLVWALYFWADLRKSLHVAVLSLTAVVKQKNAGRAARMHQAKMSSLKKH